MENRLNKPNDTSSKLMDLIFQNQSMGSIDAQTSDVDNSIVDFARVNYFQSVMITPIVGTLGVTLLFLLIGWDLHIQQELFVWLFLGLVATCWRVTLLVRYRQKIMNWKVERFNLSSYLNQVTATTTVAGMMFGWGWLTFAASLSAEEQLGFLLTNVVMLFGGLYAYGIYLPAFLGFTLLSLLPATWHLYTKSITNGLWLAEIVGLLLVMLVSQMFAFRWSQNFRHNVLLREKIYKLLTEVTEKKEQAEQATLAKSRFLASVSHDLRQPLHAINLNLVVLEKLYEKSISAIVENQKINPVKLTITQLKESALQLTQMFEALLDIAKLESGTIQANIESIPIQTVVDKFQTEYTQLAATKGLEFQIRKPDNFKEIYIEADRLMLERLLINLISNAIKNTNNGGIRLSLRVKTNALEIRVVDTGVGIKSLDKKKIFEEFYQTSQTDTKKLTDSYNSGGIGLGLAISSRLAARLNTKIRVHSHSNHGSVFAINLPFKIVTELNASNTKSEEPHVSHEHLPLREKCVLIIDDDQRICDATAQLLREYGANTITALNLNTAIEKITTTENSIDLILVDYQLENGYGTDAIKAIKKRMQKEIPAIVITGETTLEHVSIFKKMDQQVLYKPLTADKLLEAIQLELN
jgi:signal transduction histidine kinase/CheY-like chemotaxis protein